jgi:hypothetical protein
MGLREMMKQGSGEDYITSSIIICTALNIIQAIKLGRMIFADYVARTEGEARCLQGFGGET